MAQQQQIFVNPSGQQFVLLPVNTGQNPPVPFVPTTGPLNFSVVVEVLDNFGGEDALDVFNGASLHTKECLCLLNGYCTFRHI